MLKKYLDPDQTLMKTQGFKPNFVIKFLRWLSRLIIICLRLNGKSRWSNEFIQQLDPSITISPKFFNDDKKVQPIWFRTGHGRLYWRAKHTFNLEKETNDWIKSFKQSDIFFDVGANVGLYSIMASKLMKIKTYAFEPDLMNARILYENIIKNNVSNLVTILPLALADYNYCADLYLKTVSYGDALHNLDSKNQNIDSDHEAKVSIPAFSIDSIISILSLDKPTKLKIDVDGIEIRILKGAKEALVTVDEIIVEWSRSKKDSSEILEYLENLGFKLIWESNPHNTYIDTVNAFFKKENNEKRN
mgnify:CR=1 FL=1|tara:strand:- start:181 stop:1089 length:909 start_codon:yes stop_codon:yes gene_type:complete